LEILTEIHRKVIEVFSKMPDQEAFYLTGGTALSAFFLKHRMSHDLDLFTTVEDLIPSFSRKLEQELKAAGMAVDRRRGFQSFVEIGLSSGEDSTIVHMAVDSPFRLEPVWESDDFPGLKVDSLADMAANKLLALFGRAELRDFVDVYFLSMGNFGRDALIEKASLKDPGLDVYWLGVSMEKVNEFPDDAPDLQLLVRPAAMSDLRKFYNEWCALIRKRLADPET
jgi:hypothetical protein